jgi:hypothetical protein
MNEKTVPLPRTEQKLDAAVQTAHAQWGQDFHHRALFEQTRECVFIIGLDLKYIAANPQALAARLRGPRTHWSAG